MSADDWVALKAERDLALFTVNLVRLLHTDYGTGTCSECRKQHPCTTTRYLSRSEGQQ